MAAPPDFDQAGQRLFLDGWASLICIYPHAGMPPECVVRGLSVGTASVGAVAVKIALGATLLSAATPTFAADSEQALPLVLAYEASAGCPDQASFRSQVEPRLRRPVAWLPEGDARQVAVRIDERAEGAHGVLELTLANRQRTRREVFAETCAEVAASLALVMALAIDEEVALAEPARVAPEVPASRRVPSLPLPAPVAARVAPRLEIHAGPAAGVVYGPAPVALVTLGATLAARYDTGTWFSPTLYLTPLYGKTGVSGPTAPLASFTWATVRVEACPAVARSAASVRVIGCAASHLGETIVEGGSEVPLPTRQHRFWADVGLSARFEVRFRSWFVDLSGAGLVTLTRDEYVFTEPTVPVHSVPDFAYSGLFSFGVRL